MYVSRKWVLKSNYPCIVFGTYKFLKDSKVFSWIGTDEMKYFRWIPVHVLCDANTIQEILMIFFVKNIHVPNRCHEHMSIHFFFLTSWNMKWHINMMIFCYSTFHFFSYSEYDLMYSEDLSFKKEQHFCQSESMNNFSCDDQGDADDNDVCNVHILTDEVFLKQDRSPMTQNTEDPLHSIQSLTQEVDHNNPVDRSVQTGYRSIEKEWKWCRSDDLIQSAFHECTLQLFGRIYVVRRCRVEDCEIIEKMVPHWKTGQTIQRRCSLCSGQRIIRERWTHFDWWAALPNLTSTQTRLWRISLSPV